MRKLTSGKVLGGICVLVTWLAGVCAEGQCTTLHLAVIVNRVSSVDSLSAAQLRRLLLGDVRNWPDQKLVKIVARDPSSAVSQCVFAKVVRLSGPEYNRYLMNAEFRGEEPVTIQAADSDAFAARIVGGSPSAFAIVDAATLLTLGPAIKVVHINGKLPGDAGYPL